MALEDETPAQRYGFIDNLDSEVVPEIAITILTFVKENDLYERLIDEVSTFENYWEMVVAYYSTDKTYSELAEESGGRFNSAQMEFNVNRTMSVLIQTITTLDIPDKSKILELKQKIKNGNYDEDEKIFNKLDKALIPQITNYNQTKAALTVEEGQLTVITTAEMVGSVSRHPELLLKAINKADISPEEKAEIYQILNTLRLNLEYMLTFGALYSSNIGLALSLQDFEPYTFIPIEDNPWALLHEKSGLILERSRSTNFNIFDELRLSSDQFKQIFIAEGQLELADMMDGLSGKVNIIYKRGGYIENELREHINYRYGRYLEGKVENVRNLEDFIEQLWVGIKDMTYLNESIKRALAEKYTYILRQSGYRLQASGGQNIMGSYAIHCYWDYRDELASRLIKEIIEG